MDVHGKNFTPSLVSSGYGSQAVSMLTLSSEDSLSLRSMDENSEGHKERDSNKQSLEHTSSSGSDSDVDEGKGRGVQNHISHLEVEGKSEELVAMEATQDEEMVDNSVTLNSDLNLTDSWHESMEISDSGSSDVSNLSQEAQNGSIGPKPDLDSSGVGGLNKAVQKSGKTVPVVDSERLRKSKEERQRILKSLGANSDENERKTHNVIKPAAHGASAIVEQSDPYSETAMEQLECLSIDEEDFIDDDNAAENSKGKNELFISESNDKASDRTKAEVSSPPSTLEKRSGVTKRQRPVSCIVSPSHDVASLLEESMKRNSLTLHLSDDDDTSE